MQQPPIGILNNPCWTVLPGLPTEATSPGLMVIRSPDELIFLDQNFQVQQQTSEGAIGSFAATSPNGNWLAYTYYPKEGSSQIVVVSADGLRKVSVPEEISWMDIIYGAWLDNEQLWFPAAPESGYLASVVVVNPFTRVNQELPSDYPGLEIYLFGPQGIRLHFGYSSAVYDPSLDLVVYPELTESGYYYTLWDRQAQKVLGRILDDGFYRHLPLWLPDGSGFLVVGMPQANRPKEWFIVDRDGKQIRQLTHFGDSIAQYAIVNGGSISPSGRYLAFGLSLEENAHADRGKLIILDLETLKVYNTCIKIGEQMPVWSLDSQFVAVSTWNSGFGDETSPILIVHLKEWWAAPVAEGWRFEPVGWLKLP